MPSGCLISIPDNIAVIYPGIPDRYFDAVPATFEPSTACTKPFVLFVGTVEPRKNVDTLLDAWLQLPTSIRECARAGVRRSRSDGRATRL